MLDLRGGVAVVTGAASGIGRALAERLAKEQMALALCDVDVAGLEEAAGKAKGVGNGGCKVSTHVVDVADAVQMEEFAATVLKTHQRVTLLINNAGVALYGKFDELSLGDIDWLMRINFYGVVNGTKLFLPILQRESHAHIVNVSSIFGIVAPAGQTAYSASKFAIRGFTTALQSELRGTNVGVSCVFPGGIRTNIAARARPGAGGPGTIGESAKQFERLARNTPEYAAGKIVDGVKRNKARIFIGGDARTLAGLERLLPERHARLLRLT